MFCPKCGSENPGETAFCRGCGEDLKIVGQAMKKHSPVALVSKLDAAIENKNERFRRNAIFMGAFGAVFGIASVLFAVLSPANRFPIFVFPAFAVMLFGFSIWYTLVFFRSREIPAAASDDFLNDHGGSREPVVQRVEGANGKLFCPACGTRNGISAEYCRTCGQRLTLEERGLERYLPEFVVRRLDRAVLSEKDLEGAYKSRKVLWLTAPIYLFLLVANALDGDIDQLLMYLFIAISLIVITGWDYLTYRRSMEKDEKVALVRRENFDRSENESPSLLPKASDSVFFENPTVPIGARAELNEEIRDTAPLPQSPAKHQEPQTAKLAELAETNGSETNELPAKNKKG